MRTVVAELESSGSTRLVSGIEESFLDELRRSLFESGKLGERCLLENSNVREVAIQLRRVVSLSLDWSHPIVAVQAIAFDKTPSANWKVTWHQDLMFPFARRPVSPGFDLSCVKDGIDFARPPLAILERMIAVRLHLDDCGEVNGPLRVAPGTHRCGIIRSSEIAAHVKQHGEAVCLAKAGEALLMRPLLLHASSPALEPGHRRVLHVVFYSGPEISEPWLSPV